MNDTTARMAAAQYHLLKVHIGRSSCLDILRSKLSPRFANNTKLHNK